MSNIICYDVHGNTVPVAADALTFRPAVYGIFIENNHVLLLEQPESGLLYPPGVVLSDNETPTQAIRQLFRQLTGIMPRLGPMLYVEDQYVVDEERRAWQYAAVYYGLERSTAAATLPETDAVIWLRLDELDRSRLQFGFEAVQAARLQLKL